MGAIKDLVDLTTQLANSVQDRKIAAEINAIQNLILKLQAEQAELHETNMALREEKLTLKERIQQLEEEVTKLKIDRPKGLANKPTCPNCSTVSRPVYLSPLPQMVVRDMGANYHCTSCRYMEMVEIPEDGDSN